MSKGEDRDWIYYMLLVLAMFFWGGSWVSAKILVTIAPPMTIGFFRFFLASILFVPILFRRKSRESLSIQKSDIKIVLKLGLTGVFGYGVLFLIGVKLTTAAQGAIIAGVNPATVSIIAHLQHNEYLEQRWQYLGFVISFIGVIFVIGVQNLIHLRVDYLVGNMIIVCSMILWGLYSSFAKTAMKTLTAIEATAGGVMIGALLFGIFALTEGFWTLPVMYDVVFWINILFMGGLVTLVSFIIYFKSIDALGATRSGVFINLVPVFGTLMSVLILNESLLWTFALGLILVIAGITFISNKRENCG